MLKHNGVLKKTLVIITTGLPVSDTDVILPGDTERILFTFKSVRPGVMTEVWKLNTHPVLMGGAMLQVKLKGVALYQDKLAEQRAALEVCVCVAVRECVCVSAWM